MRRVAVLVLGRTCRARDVVQHGVRADGEQELAVSPAASCRMGAPSVVATGHSQCYLVEGGDRKRGAVVQTTAHGRALAASPDE